MPAKHKVLIIGSSGMLGIDLWKELDVDYAVYGADLVERKELDVKRFEKCNITDKSEVARVLLKIRPEIVIHTAALTDVDGCEFDSKKAYSINSDGTENVALACKSIGATLIYISTDFVFDGKKGSPYKETDEPAPLGVYAASKLKGEEAVKKHLTDYFILRTSWLYGKNGKNFVDTIIDKARTVKELKVVDDQIGSPTYTVDLAKAIHALLNKAVMAPGTYNISNSGSTSWFEYAKAILELTGSKTRVISMTSEELNRPAKRPAMSVLDNSKLTASTGYAMRNWKEALKEYLSC